MQNHRAVVTATDLNSQGQAVFRFDGRVGFAEGLLPGETGEIKFALKNGIWIGKLIHRLTSSPDRCEHPCIHSKLCPASPLGSLKIEAQKEYKLNTAKQVLKRIAKIDWEEINFTESEKHWNYRNKIEFSVGKSIRGRWECGYHSNQDTERIIPIQECLLAEDLINQFWAEFLKNKNHINFIQKCKRVILKGGNGVHFHFILKENLNNEDKEFLTKFYYDARGLNGITFSILKEKPIHIFKGQLRIQGFDGIETHPLTFRQVNDQIAKAIQDQVIQSISQLEGEVWDLYGGFGFLSYKLAGQKRAVKVFEKNEYAIEDGKRIKGIKNLQFVQMDIQKQFLNYHTNTNPTAIILDPPYTGAGVKVCSKILKLRPKKIIYISCHGAALARDLKILLNSEYQIKKVKLLDMFPQTTEIEWFVELDNEKA